MSGWALRIDGLPYILTVKGVSSITSWSDGDDPGQTVAEDTLEPVDGDLSERLRPLEGQVDVSALSFVVHDLPLGSAQYGLSDLFTRRLNGITKTYLTASAAAGDTLFSVADLSIFTSLPRDAWVNSEAVSVTGTALGQITVTRARYGTKARAIEVSSADAILPEIYLSCPWVTRRRCVLYRVRDGAATVRWIGYADHAPRLNEDGASWTISATWAGQRELTSKLATETGGARTFGYDERVIAMQVMREDDSTIIASGARADNRGHTFSTLLEAAQAVGARLRTSLAAVAGVSHASVSVSLVGSQLSINVAATGLDDFRLAVFVGDIRVTATSADTAGSIKRAQAYVDQPDLGGLSILGWPKDRGDDRYTVLALQADTPTANSYWQTSNASYPVAVHITAMLSAEWSDKERVVLDPRQQSAGTITVADTSVTPTGTTFKGRAYLRPTDPAAQYVPPTAYAVALATRGVLLFRREFFVESDHWLYALRWLCSDVIAATQTDTRNWDWSRDAIIAGYTSGGSATAVRWRIDSSRDFGEFVRDECLLRGACLSVRSGKLTIDAIRPPTAAERVAATITPAELEAGRLPQWEDWEDGLRTSVTVVSPIREVTLIDKVSQMRHGDTPSLRLRAEGLRDEARALTDPIAWARDIAMRPLRLWSDPVYLVRLPCTVALVDTVQLGDMIEITQPVLPDALGGRGMSSVRAQVIGITEGLRTGTLEIEALVWPVEYGYAPCARVASISGAVLTLATAYAGSAGDYSGSTLTSYDGTASDGGASRFAVGDKVLLIQRDTSTLTTEAHTIASINPTGPTITLSSAPSGAWSGYAIVDVMYDNFGTSTATQRAAYAYVCSSTAPQIIGSTSEPGRHWAT